MKSEESQVESFIEASKAGFIEDIKRAKIRIEGKSAKEIALDVKQNFIILNRKAVQYNQALKTIRDYVTGEYAEKYFIPRIKIERELTFANDFNNHVFEVIESLQEIYAYLENNIEEFKIKELEAEGETKEEDLVKEKTPLRVRTKSGRYISSKTKNDPQRAYKGSIGTPLENMNKEIPKKSKESKESDYDELYEEVNKPEGDQLNA